MADKKIEFCNLCEKCVSSNCVLEDDVNGIIEEMKNADGIIFVIPKYLFVASKFLCFLERLDTVRHMRTHGGYQHTAKNPDYRLFSSEKPFCIFVVSGTGKVEKGTLNTVVEYIEYLGLKLVRDDKPPFLGVSVKAGDAEGEVLANKKSIEECKKMVEKLVGLIKK